MKLNVHFAIVLAVPAALMINQAVSAQVPTAERVSISSSGVQANGDCWFPALSADGRFSAFATTANSLVAGDTNGSVNLGSDVFVHDHQTGITERVSVSTAGVEGNHNSGEYQIAISADGRFVAFDSRADNLVAGYGGASTIFVRDRQLGTTECITSATRSS